MATTFKHLKLHEMPSSTLMSVCLSVAPAMQSIIVDRVPVVNPQLAPIIRNDTESIQTSSEDPHAGCPTHSEMIAS
jgi:hypothetical protein